MLLGEQSDGGGDANTRGGATAKKAPAAAAEDEEYLDETTRRLVSAAPCALAWPRGATDAARVLAAHLADGALERQRHDALCRDIDEWLRATRGVADIQSDTPLATLSWTLPSPSTVSSSDRRAASGGGGDAPPPRRIGRPGLPSALSKRSRAVDLVAVARPAPDGLRAPPVTVPEEEGAARAAAARGALLLVEVSDVEMRWS
jgi:hypothetical protein